MAHWFNVELWGPIWPNLAASAITFTAGLLWAHRKFLAGMREMERRHMERHEELKDMLNQAPLMSDAERASRSPLEGEK